MFKIIGKTIQITRGDTAFLEVTPMNGDIPYVLTDNDTLTLTVKDSPSKEEYRFQKKLTNKNYTGDNRLLFKIERQDTESLRYKDYYYDVELSRENGNLIDTIITPNLFSIMEEVSF